MSTVPMPEVPQEMRAEVTRDRTLVARSMRCWSVDARVAHTPAPECPEWYAQLARGGPAAMHAIGTFFCDDMMRRLLRTERALTESAARSTNDEGSGAINYGGTSLITAERLAPVFGGFDAREVVPYVLAGAGVPIRRGYGDWGANERINRWLDVLPRVTGNDLTPIPEWQRAEFDVDGYMRVLGDAHDTWARWYRAHANESLAEWRAQGLARARTALTGRDVAQRVAAILRLGEAAQSPDEQEAARRSLVELLAQRRLSNAGRRYMRGVAERRGWSLDADAGIATDAAR